MKRSSRWQWVALASLYVGGWLYTNATIYAHCVCPANRSQTRLLKFLLLRTY